MARVSKKVSTTSKRSSNGSRLFRGGRGGFRTCALPRVKRDRDDCPRDLLLARSRRMASYAFLASYVQCGTANGASRPDPARRQHLGGLARCARRGVGSDLRETPHLE